MAEEKAQAQRRLLRVNRRRAAEKSEVDKRRESIERRKEELVKTLCLYFHCWTSFVMWLRRTVTRVALVSMFIQLHCQNVTCELTLGMRVHAAGDSVKYIYPFFPLTWNYLFLSLTAKWSSRVLFLHLRISRLYSTCLHQLVNQTIILRLLILRQLRDRFSRCVTSSYFKSSEVCIWPWYNKS